MGRYSVLFAWQTVENHPGQVNWKLILQAKYFFDIYKNLGNKTGSERTKI